MEGKKEFFDKLLHKKVRLMKQIGSRPQFYSGVITKVLEDCLVIDDSMMGEVIVNFDGITILRVEGYDGKNS